MKMFSSSIGLKNEIRAVCAEEFLVCGEGDEQGSTWMDKVCSKLIVTNYIKTYRWWLVNVGGGINS